LFNAVRLDIQSLLDADVLLIWIDFSTQLFRQEGRPLRQFKYSCATHWGMLEAHI